VAVGVGGAGILVGGITGFLAMDKRSTLDCPDDSCTADKQDDVDSYNSLRTISTIGFIGGAVIAATGGVLLLTDNEKKEVARITPLVGPGRIGIGGRF
jgi:hypothetical protein